VELNDETAHRGQTPRARGASLRDRLPGPAGLGRVEAALVRLMSPLAMVVVAATVLCCVLAIMLAKQADDHLEDARRQALRGAVEALQQTSPGLTDLDPKHLRMLESAAGLQELRLAEAPPEDSRPVQSLIDPKGRIVGWFTWQPERPATAVVAQLVPFGAMIALGLFAFAAMGIWQLRRLGSLLTDSTRQVQRLAYEDPLTGLSNLYRMRDTIEATLAKRRPNEVVTVALVDLGGFDEMKEAIGEAGEDEVLAEIANRLRSEVPGGVKSGVKGGAEVARLRGDRFGLVMCTASAEDALSTVQAMRDVVSRAIWVDQLVQVSANAGLAVAPRDGGSCEELMRRADLALRAAKRRGRGLIKQFSADMEGDFDERRFIRRELSRAMAAHAFEVHYQPIVKADGGAIVGVESLLRWNHPNRGYIPPGLFVPVAEQAGMMDQLGAFVLRRALTDAARWPDLYVTVNLSPVQVRDRRFVEVVKEALAETSTDPSRVVLEITEGVLIDDPLAAKARLEDLRRIGVQLALDDFGSGYSSLAYLQQLPFDKLKIDRGFVAALDQSANTGVIIQAIVTLGRALGMSVLIEGVETEEQRVLLRLAGCNEMQGFLFARPAAVDEIDRLVAAGQPLPLVATRLAAAG
jgi:diguanylate cyclase (GGDEF)-like protein